MEMHWFRLGVHKVTKKPLFDSHHINTMACTCNYICKIIHKLCPSTQYSGNPININQCRCVNDSSLSNLHRD
jgi:hypothetical protein